MQFNTQLLERIAKDSSRAGKQSLIAQMDFDTRMFVTTALDPMVTFGVTVDERAMIVGVNERQPLVEGHVRPSREEWWDELRILLSHLSSRALTGNDAVRAIESHTLSTVSEQDIVWACRILNRDLRAGFGPSTLNKVFPDSIAEFKVQLAEPYDVEKHTLEGSWIYEKKLDGLRMATVASVPYTRNGHVISSVGHILDELGRDFLKDFVLDGELTCASGKVEFDEISGRVRQKDGTDESIVYNVFDLVHIDDWMSRSTPSLAQRKMDMEELFSTPLDHIRPLQWAYLPTARGPEDVLALMDQMVLQGYEGLILKDMSQPYQFKRSRYLLKLKPFKDIDLPIVDLKEGKGKYEGMLGAIYVEMDGVQTKVGTGFDDAQRTALWTPDTIGRIAEVKYQNVTSKRRLRFPVFKGLRPDKE